MLRTVLIAVAVATCLAASTACVDPGCIRNSECGAGFYCMSARCIRVGDAGTASTTKAGTGGSVLIAPKDAGAQPDAGSTDTPAPDAGKM
jgi:hypothetical protein